MTRLCERPGCSEPGAAAYGMRPEDLVFWLAPLDRWNQHANGVLCRRHADAMVVPRGWTLDDRREPVPRLFRPASPPIQPPPVQAAREDRPRRRSVPPATEPLDFEAVQPEPSPASSTALDEVPPPAWRPTFDTDDDLDGLLEVRSPLLARAFRGEGRNRRPDA